jgi:hypothetical protein
MAINDFYPFQPNKKVTLEQWNELFEAIADGSFFLQGAPIADLVATLASRVAALEQSMAFLSALKGRNFAKKNAVLADLQSQVTLTHTPVLDSEQVFLNGVALTKTGVDIDFIGDYSVDSMVITLHPDVAREIAAGDILSVTYQYEVPGNV